MENLWFGYQKIHQPGGSSARNGLGYEPLAKEGYLSVDGFDHIMVHRDIC